MRYDYEVENYDSELVVSIWLQDNLFIELKADYSHEEIWSDCCPTNVPYGEGSVQYDDGRELEGIELELETLFFSRFTNEKNETVEIDDETLAEITNGKSLDSLVEDIDGDIRKELERDLKSYLEEHAL